VKASSRVKLAVLLGSMTVAIGGVWLVLSLRQREPPPVLTIVDTRQSLEQLLAERAAKGPPPDTIAGLIDPRLRREPMDVATAQLFFPPAGVNRPYNPHFFCANEPNVTRWVPFLEHANGGLTMRTNSLGMMEDEEVLATHPDLRILVAGDSHGVGLCENTESFTNRLEARLRESPGNRTVEALNASVGGYNFYNYLGVLEEYVTTLAPDVFVMAVYGGNDFRAMMQLQRYYHYRPPFKPNDAWSLETERKLKPPQIASQELGQVQYFLNNPEDIELAVDTADAITLEAERICREHDIALIVLYIPPPFLAQPRYFDTEMRSSLALTGLNAGNLIITNRMANAWLKRLAARSVDVIDLRKVFSESRERMYYVEHDCHTNVAAHALIGELLAAHVEEALRKHPAR